MAFGYILFIFLIAQATPISPVKEFGPGTFLEPEKYVLQPGDRFLIVVKANAIYSFQTFVTPDGNLPLYRVNLANAALDVQNMLLSAVESQKMLDVETIIDVKGKTLLEAKNAVKNFYGETYKNIDIKIALIEGGKTCVYIEGEVRKPGAFSYYPNMKINDYIGMAGGATVNADRKGIYIIRNGEKIKIINGEKIQKGDKIIIPKNRIRDYLPIIQRSVSVIYSISVIVWYSLNIWKAR